MKIKITLLLIVFLSQSASAFLLVNPMSYKDPRCSRPPNQYQFESSELLFEGTDYEMNTSDIVDSMVRELQDIRSKLIAAGDKKLKSNKAHCNGIFDDTGRPNAYAVNYTLIRMGKNLIKDIRMSYSVFANDILTLVLYHEFAHSIQSRYKWKYPSKNKNKRIKLREMQSDCMAGVFFKMQHRYNGNTNNVFRLFANHFGDHSSTGTHGTYKQRYKSLIYGTEIYDANSNKKHKMNSKFILKNLCSTNKMVDIIEKRISI